MAGWDDDTPDDRDRADHDRAHQERADRDGPDIGGAHDGPWDSSFLDDDFIQSAAIVEPSAEERLRRHQRRVRVENLYQRLAAESTAAPIDPFAVPVDVDDDWEPRRRPPHLRLIALALIAVLIIGAVVRFTDSLSTSSDTRALHTGKQDVLDFEPGGTTATPPPSSEERDSPIGTPPTLPDAEGPFTFIATQPDGTAPIAYDPCRPIHYVTNTRNAPDDAGRMVSDAIAETSRATGLSFIDDGSSDEQPSMSRAAYQPERYPDRWAPVLIAWTDPGTIAELAGDTAGLGGSNGLELPATVAGGRTSRVYVTGLISLDGPQFTELADQGASEDQLRSVIQHELGHVVGLGHVDDADQLMYPTTADTTAWGAGDLRGLAELGGGDCFPTL